ncbi:MAG: thioredoxin [Promethearchaeia archaeon]
MADNELERIRRKKAKRLMEKAQTTQSNKKVKNIVKINSMQEYQNLIKQYPEKIMVLDFWAEWCAPCKTFGPIFKKLSKEFQEEFIFGKVNIDQNQQLAAQFQISSIPSTIFVKEGKIIKKLVGAVGYQNLKSIFHKLKEKN